MLNEKLRIKKWTPRQSGGFIFWLRGLKVKSSEAINQLALMKLMIRVAGAKAEKNLLS
jgi:hypothetical protein